MAEQTPQPVAIQEPRGLHPMWIGAIALALLSSAALVLISYIVFDFEWQQRFGIGNVWLGTVLGVSIVVPLRLWTTSSSKA